MNAKTQANQSFTQKKKYYINKIRRYFNFESEFSEEVIQLNDAYRKFEFRARTADCRRCVTMIEKEKLTTRECKERQH